ncbi:MAG: hypothetical protein NWF04_01600 [Candidatus Bathyarchaeota archaeon]|nr:hypothetical protein [Candidatus Bathyarchaeota archaeon]
MSSSARKKEPLNVTIDKDVKEKAITEAHKKNIPLSRLIENFLKFFVDPQVYCYHCGKEFHSSETLVCTKCSSMKCPACGSCACSLSEETSKAIFYMRRVYEDLLAGRVKEQ